MTLDSLVEALPNYAKDLKLNYSTLVRNQTELTAQQLWGTVVACAMAGRNPQVIAAALAEAASKLSPQALEAAKAAAAVMGMNNVFYRFQHVVSNAKYRSMPARLRMNVMRTHGVEQLDFELWCTAVSAINNCVACVDSHERVLREKGIGEEIVVAAIRVASVINAISTVTGAEAVSAAAE